MWIIVFIIKSQDLVKHIASFGYDLDEKWRADSDRGTILYQCCQECETHRDMIGILLDLGADPNNLNGRMLTTSVHLLIENGEWDLYERFIHHPNININLRNSLGSTILHHLVQFADIATLSEFLELTTYDINAQDTFGYTALHQATLLRKTDAIRKLLDVYGIRLDICDKQGRTPLTVATFWGYKDVALTLIEYSKVFPTPNPDQLSSLVCAAKQGDKALTHILLLKHRFKNLDHHIDMSGKTVLHHIAINNWPDILEEILQNADKNTSIDKLDHSGKSTLHYAATLGNTEACRVLLNYGASVRLQDRNGQTAAHAAANAGFTDTLMVLLAAKNLDVNQWDQQGRNLVHWAATIDSTKVMELVLKKQADVNIARRDNMRLMPIDIAFNCECPNVGRLLEREMRLRNSTTIFVNIYDWDSLYSNTIADFMDIDDPSLEIYEEPLLVRESKRQKITHAEWEYTHLKWPEEHWGLVDIR